jgi:glycogen debranching enzyme
MLGIRVAFVLLGASVAALSQQPPARSLHNLPEFVSSDCDLMVRRPPQVGEPMTVAGPQGVIVGQQQGVLETWILPVKLLSHLTLQADVSGYPVPLDLNTMARDIQVCPDHTTITYSHIALTVRQIMFAPANSAAGTGAVILFAIDSVRPATITVRFTPEMRQMWPMPSSGNPSAEWVKGGGTGFYVLHTDFPDLAGAVAVPGASPGIMAPYQERPQVHPLELTFNFDPRKDRGQLFPMLMAVGSTKQSATTENLETQLLRLNDGVAALYAETRDEYAKRLETLTTVVTPDASLNADLSWAETALYQLRARTTPASGNNDGEVGLVAGYYASGDSARPGFGWFFGRDTLYTTYALDSDGDFHLAREALEFLVRRQRSDGKMMHEYSQTAALTDWSSLPYEYAAADATPLFILASLDYVRSSGDVSFLESNRNAIYKAWRFESTHDTDGDGIYDNAEGTGWVESWPSGMPHQEIYLALLDQQASAAMSELANLVHDQETGRAALERARSIHATIEREYFLPDGGSYAFSRNADGTQDRTSTVYPSLAWWSSHSALDHPGRDLRTWSSHEFDTDWGMRDVGESESVYDPISYHQGSVWPLFTGWAAIAEYRSGHPLAGYQLLMQNADLTSAQDPGAVTELLSGAFFEPFGRSTSHQLWSSAMVIIPVLRGLFGIDSDALRHTLNVTPHLPATWDTADVRRLALGDSVLNLHYRRTGAVMEVNVQDVSGPPVTLQNGKQTISMPLPAVEVSIPHGLPPRGSRTAQLKVLNESYQDRTMRLEIEALGGSEWAIPVRLNNTSLKVRVDGAELANGELRVRLPSGTRYVSHTITIAW